MGDSSFRSRHAWGITAGVVVILFVLGAVGTFGVLQPFGTGISADIGVASFVALLVLCLVLVTIFKQTEEPTVIYEDEALVDRRTVPKLVSDEDGKSKRRTITVPNWIEVNDIFRLWASGVILRLGIGMVVFWLIYTSMLGAYFILEEVFFPEMEPTVFLAGFTATAVVLALGATYIWNEKINVQLLTLDYLDSDDQYWYESVQLDSIVAPLFTVTGIYTYVIGAKFISQQFSEFFLTPRTATFIDLTAVFSTHVLFVGVVVTSLGLVSAGLSILLPHYNAFWEQVVMNWFSSEESEDDD